MTVKPKFLDAIGNACKRFAARVARFKLAMVIARPHGKSAWPSSSPMHRKTELLPQQEYL